MKITFQTDVSFSIGAIVNASEIADLRAQDIMGDVEIINLLPGLRRSNPNIARGRFRYLARPYPLDYDPVEVSDA